MDSVLEDMIVAVLEEEKQYHPAMERRIAESYKSTANAEFNILSPKKDALCVNTIHFIFKDALDENTLLHFKNVEGETAGRFEIPKGSKSYEVSIEDSKQFPSGLYYWTLLGKAIPFSSRLYICTKEEAQLIVENVA